LELNDLLIKPVNVRNSFLLPANKRIKELIIISLFSDLKSILIILRFNYLVLFLNLF